MSAASRYSQGRPKAARPIMTPGSSRQQHNVRTIDTCDKGCDWIHSLVLSMHTCMPSAMKRTLYFQPVCAKQHKTNSSCSEWKSRPLPVLSHCQYG
jgi:hypothetical protein